MTNKTALGVAVVLVVVMIAAVLLLLSHGRPTSSNFQNETLNMSVNQTDPYAHLSTAKFALVAPYVVLGSNPRFASLAKEKYDFLYSNASNFASVENSQFIVLVVNGSYPIYMQLALKAVNASVLGYALNDSKGEIISRSDVWGPNQTVFILAGYRSANSLASALLSFFVRQPVYAPHQVVGKFAAFNGLVKGFSANDPILDAYLGNMYELGPHDTSLKYPYSYYDQFAYLLYYAPVIMSLVPGFAGNVSGLGLPMDSLICIPPPPPPDGSSLCIGDYVAMPMFQFGSAPPQAPALHYDTGDCNFFGIDDCIDAEGWAASGINPQLPYREIPSVYFGFTATGSEIPPSMSGTAGPVSDYLPITWWVYGPGSLGESTGGIQSGIMPQNETQLLMNASVEMFSAPLGESPLGNFTVYNATNAMGTYSCFSSLCGMDFNYALYALLSVSSTIPKRANVLSPRNYSPAPYANYSAILDPVTLTTPKVVKTPSKNYYFSYWSVYSELDGNQYYQQFYTSNATFQLIGPTQAQAVYTSRSLPGAITATAEYMTPSAYISCPPILNCTISSSYPIGGVRVSITNMSGAPVYSNTTGTNGRFITPTLAGNCYLVTAHKAGYNFIVMPNPLCVNGPGGVFAVDTSPYIFEASWPKGYAYGGAPPNATLQINLTLSYVNGIPAGGVMLHAHANSGAISGPAKTSDNGTADFIWHAGGGSGIYYLNFTASGIFIPPQTYSMPVVVYSGNYSHVILNVSLSNSAVTGAPGTSLIDRVTVHVCQFAFNLSSNATLSCVRPYAVNMSISDLPTGVNASFSPNPALANTITLNDATDLHISLGSSAHLGRSTAYVTAKVDADNRTYHAIAPLSVNVSYSQPSNGTGGGPPGSNSSGYGAINFTVYFNGAPAAAARIWSPPFYTGGWYTGSNGKYYTGYTVKAGKYEFIGTYDNISNTTIVTVKNNTVAYAYIRINGATTTSTSTSTSTSSSTTSSTPSTSTTTIASQGYYSCNTCYKVIIGGYSCPPSCPSSTQCSYGGFECT